MIRNFITLSGWHFLKYKNGIFVIEKLSFQNWRGRLDEIMRSGSAADEMLFYHLWCDTGYVFIIFSGRSSRSWSLALRSLEIRARSLHCFLTEDFIQFFPSRSLKALGRMILTLYIHGTRYISRHAANRAGSIDNRKHAGASFERESYAGVGFGSVIRLTGP